MTPAIDVVKKSKDTKEHNESSKISRNKKINGSNQPKKSKKFTNQTHEEFDHDLSKTPSIPLQTQLDYARNGHSVLRSFLPPQLLSDHFYPLLYEHHHSAKNSLAAWQQKVEVAGSLPSSFVKKKCPTISSCQSQLKEILQTPMVEIPFLQHFNTWRSHSLIKQLVTSPILASTAATLLDVPSVRLYQDALFVKNLSKDGPTPWHADAKMAPFDTTHFITFWIPLQPIPKNGGTGLRFVDKSHNDFALPFWNEENSVEYNRLEERYSFDDFYVNSAHEDRTCVKDHMPLSVGDVTVHAGWTLHCADAGYTSDNKNRKGGERYALAVSYVDASAEVREEYFQRTQSQTKRLGDAEDQLSFRDWIGEVQPRQYLKHPLVPIVWPKRSGRF